MPPGSRRRSFAVTTVAALMVLSGCGEPMTDEELFDRAREVNFAYKAAVADVQLELFDGEWTLEGYGDTPESCGDDGYSFSLGRSTPFEWRFEGTPTEAAARIGDWLDNNGWTGITTRTYTDGIANVVIQAEKPDAHVDELTIDFNPGQRSDMITITADSTCEPGDWMAVAEVQLPGITTGTAVEIRDDRTTEHPGVAPSFGYNDDGTPRFWSDDTD